MWHPADVGMRVCVCVCVWHIYIYIHLYIYIYIYIPTYIHTFIYTHTCIRTYGAQSKLERMYVCAYTYIPIFCFNSYFYISIRQGSVPKPLSDGLDGVGRQVKPTIVFQVLFHIQKYFSHKTKTTYLFNDYMLMPDISITVGRKPCAGTTRLWTCIQKYIIIYDEPTLRSLRLSVACQYTYIHKSGVLPGF